MSTAATYHRWHGRLLEGMAKVDWLPALLARIWLGVSFLMSGFHKATHGREAVEHFAQLGIAAPGFFAPLVSTVELVGGVLLIVGLFTRAAALPLIVTMIVATITAKVPGLKKPGDFLLLGEPLYALLLLWLVVDGAGRASLDHVLDRRLEATALDPGPRRRVPPLGGLHAAR
jgi:putative oxidoreductase